MLQKYTTISRRRNFFNEYGVFHHENPRICGKRDAIRWKIGRFCGPYGPAERRSEGPDSGGTRAKSPAWALLGFCIRPLLGGCWGGMLSGRFLEVVFCLLPAVRRPEVACSRRGGRALRFVNLGGFRLFAVFIAQGGRESGLRIFQTFYCIFLLHKFGSCQKRPDFGMCGYFVGLGRLAGGMAIWLAGLRPTGDGTILQ